MRAVFSRARDDAGPTCGEADEGYRPAGSAPGVSASPDVTRSTAQRYRTLLARCPVNMIPKGNPCGHLTFTASQCRGRYASARRQPADGQALLGSPHATPALLLQSAEVNLNIKFKSEGSAGRAAVQEEGNRTQQDGSGMTAIKRMAAVATMAALLTGPVAAPNQPPGRPRRGFYPWHVFADWLGYRRQVRQESGGTDRRRRNKSR
jgi:hypothetical protein